MLLRYGACLYCIASSFSAKMLCSQTRKCSNLFQSRSIDNKNLLINCQYENIAYLCDKMPPKCHKCDQI